MLLLIIVLVLLFNGGTGYYGYSRWGKWRRYAFVGSSSSDRAGLIPGRRIASVNRPLTTLTFTQNH